MTNYANGHHAEVVAADYLKKQGYEVLAQNWRTRYCEVDLIVQKKKTVYFVEVKYRLTENQGGGLDYVTPRKLKQMQFAAEAWVGENDWSGLYQLAAIEVAGSEFIVTDFVLDLT